MRRFTRTRTCALAKPRALLPSAAFTHNHSLSGSSRGFPPTKAHPWIAACRGFASARGNDEHGRKLREGVAGRRGLAGALGLVLAGIGMALLGSNPVRAHEKESSGVVFEVREGEEDADADAEVDVDDEEDEGYSSEKDPKSILATAASRPNFSDGSQFYIPPAIDSKMKVFSGNGNWHLANEISMHLGVQLGTE